MKAELDSVVDRGILIQVTTPTKWVNLMAVVDRVNDKLTMCPDPQSLNSALLLEHYNLPVLHDLLPKLHIAKLFSKLEVKEAYWYCQFG